MSDTDVTETEPEAAESAPPAENQPDAPPGGEFFEEIDPGAPPADGAAPTSKPSRGIDALLGVSMEVQIVLGRCRLPISNLLDLSKGSVIELDRQIGDPVDVLVNDRLVARGDLVKLEGDRIGVTLNEIIKDRDADG